MKKKLVFNLNGDDSDKNIINANCTNLLNLNNVKYDWALNLYNKMLSNFWIPQKVDLTKDTTDYINLTKEEKKAFNGTFSFLVFLDSIQTVNLSKLSDYITNSEVVLALSCHQFQESIHSVSYQYVIESVIPINDRNEIYDFWKNNNYLTERIQYITSLYEQFNENNIKENFELAIIANFILESIYFYNSFNFFYNLASRHLMIGTSDIIRYIAKDEETHVVLFQRLIDSLNLNKNKIYDLISVAVEHEIKWNNYLIGNNVLGINTESIENYTKFLANKRLSSIGLDKLYPTYNYNPYKHLERISDVGSDNNVKSNFFESTVTNYQTSNSIKDGDW